MWLPHVLYGTHPSVGAEASVTIPSGFEFRPIIWTTTLTTNATVTNREMAMQITDGNVVLFQESIGALAASLTRLIVFYAGNVRVGSDTATGFSVSCLPLGLCLKGGYVVSSDTNNLQAGDQYDSPRLTGWIRKVLATAEVETYLEPQP